MSDALQQQVTQQQEPAVEATNVRDSQSQQHKTLAAAHPVAGLLLGGLLVAFASWIGTTPPAPVVCNLQGGRTCFVARDKQIIFSAFPSDGRSIYEVHHKGFTKVDYKLYLVSSTVSPNSVQTNRYHIVLKDLAGNTLIDCDSFEIQNVEHSTDYKISINCNTWDERITVSGALDSLLKKKTPESLEASYWIGYDIRDHFYSTRE